MNKEQQTEPPEPTLDEVIEYLSKEFSDNDYRNYIFEVTLNALQELTQRRQEDIEDAFDSDQPIIDTEGKL